MNIKKIIGIVVFFIALGVQGQNAELCANNARNSVDRMTEVMGLSEEQAREVYDLRLKANLEVAEVRKKNPDLDREAIREKIRPIEQYFNQKLRNLVGSETLKKWGDYNKAKRANK